MSPPVAPPPAQHVLGDLHVPAAPQATEPVPGVPVLAPVLVDALVDDVPLDVLPDVAVEVELAGDAHDAGATHPST
jgi:hypothetical protein